MLTKIGEKPWWWMLLVLIPIVDIVILIVLSRSIAERFGKDPGFGVGHALLTPIFWMILGLGDAQYRGSNPAAPATC